MFGVLPTDFGMDDLQLRCNETPIMDDRQYAFLARQPSAALKNRERFLGMPKRGLAFLLANVMFWQPMWAQADGIVVSAPGTGLDRAGNGVPIVNIAKPNGSGLSHNQFKDYNVGSNGVILNNATNRTQSTQLGGIIVGNPNLQGASATTILNEVNGGNPSQLRGYTEVAGQSAHVIVANPYGISCNGCGFINSPKVTLSTGKPVLENGRLDRYQVDQGSVAIEGAGLNASNVDHFEIITRSAKINAEIQAKNLTIVAGRNDVNADTLSATARADDGSAKPELAIDSSALGGMYAGAIKLVGTEAGVGVKLDGKLIASGGDIQLDANGHLSMVDTSASGAVNVKAASLDARGPVYAGTTLNAQTQGNLSNQQTLAARDGIVLSAGGQLTNNGIIEAGVNADNTRNASGDVSLTAQSLNNGKSIVASRNLTANVAQTLTNQGGTLSAGQTATVKAGTLDNQNKGRVLSSGALGVTADKLLNTQGIVSSNGNLTANVGQLVNNAGELSSLGNVTLRVASLDNVAGLAAAGQMLDITASGQINNQSGRLTASKNAQLSAASLDNRQGSLSSQQGLNLNLAGQLLNAQGSVISSDTLQLKAGQVNNAAGRIASAKALDASVTGLDQQGGQLFSNTSVALDLNHGQLNNQGGLINAPGSLLLKNLAGVNNRDGEISSNQAFSLNATSLDNSAGNLSSNADLTVNIDGTLTNLDGEISSAGLTRLNALALNNSSGQVLGDNALDIDVGGALDNRNGVLGSGKAVTIKAASLNNSAGGQLISDGSLTARISGVLDNQKGEVVAKGAIDLQTGHLDNRGGRLAGNDLLSVHSDSVDNRGGSLRADKALQLTVDQLDNRDAGVISGKSSVTFDGARLDNRAGLLTSVGPLTLKANEVQNALGRISSQGQLTANIGALQQQGGALVAQGNLSLTADTLDNRNGGLVGTTKALDLQVGQIDNRAGELSAGLGATLGGQRLDNSDGGKLIVGTDLEMKVAELINQSKGLIHAQGHMTLSGRSLDNSEGQLNSLNGLVITLDNALLNNKGLISSEGELTIEAGSLDNTAGSLSSAAMLSMVSGAGLINQGGSISTDASLTVKSASLDNSQKGLISGKAATQLTTGALNNSQGGFLTSGNTLTLNATQVNNAAGRIASSQALTASITGLEQQQGELFSNTRLSLDLNQGQLNNQGGLINASGALLLSNLKDVNNQGGEISSKQAFTLAAENFDNNDGKLLSNQGLMLRIAQVLNNVRGVISAASLDSRSNRLDNSDGLISSRDRLDLTVDTLLDNQRGSLIADGALLLVADRLDNRAGSIAGKTGLDAAVSAVDNRQGTLISTDALTLKASSLDNRQAGLVGATKALDLDVDELDNRGGELSGNADVTLVSQNLDNSDGGQVLAGQALKLTVDKLLNRAKGLLSAKTELELNGGSLDNSGGYLVSQQNQRINLSRDLLNTQGQLSSEGTLSVTAANLTNTGGSLSSAADLTVQSLGRVDNQGGELLTDGALLLTSAALDNRQQGNISAKGAANVTTGAFDNSQKGRLNSGGTLNLVAGQVTNKDGASIGSQGALTASVTGLDQQGGKLFSNATLSLDLNNGQLNNQGGLINAPGTLLLKNLNGVNNQGGEISSAQAFTLTAQNLTNDNGKLLSSQSLTLRIAQALNNVKGLIGAASVDVKAASLDNTSGVMTSRSDLNLAITEQLVNRDGGLLNASQRLKLDGASLDNRGGQLLAGEHLALTTTGDLNNDGKGLINSLDSLTLTTAQLRNAGGEISSKGALQVQANSLSQQGGRLIGESTLALLLGLAAGDLDNRGGLIQAKGALTLSNLRDLDNRQGEISSLLGFNVAARALDNSSGRLISGQHLGLGATTLTNQGGLISGWQGVNINAASLDNRNNGTLSSRDGDLELTLTDTLDNSVGGALASQGLLKVKAAGLDNRGGYLASVGAQQLDLRGGTLDNSQGGRIDSGTALTLQAASLDNQGGTLAGQGPVTLDLTSQLNNAQGKLLSVADLLIRGNAAVLNQGGQLVSQARMSLTGASFDNSDKGTLAANGALALNVGDAVLNDRDGLIHSQGGDVTVRAARLSNQAGAVQGKGTVEITTTGAFDNQGGKVIAQNGNVLLKAASADNRAGILASLQGLLDAQVGGLLRNGQGGAIQARQLKLIALGGLDNSGGRLAAQAGPLEIRTGNLDNRGGGIYAQGQVSINAADLDNGAGGQLAGQSLDFTLGGVLSNVGGILESDSRIGLSAASLNNQGGQLRTLGSSGSTRLQVTGVLDNRNGVMEVASQDLTLQAGSFLNTGGRLLHGGAGEFQIDLTNLGNAGGDIVTLGGLTLSAANWTNSSVVQAARLNIDIGQLTVTGSGQLLATDSLTGRGSDWTNNGLIASNGTLDVALTGQYAGNGQVTSLGNFGLSAAAVQVSGAGRIAGAKNVQVRAGGTLVNQGRITSAGDLTLNTANLSNSGTIGSAGKLDLVSQVLRNEGTGAGNQSLISSGGDMRLLVGDFSNRFATVYSLGGLLVAGDAALNRANRIDNVSATLQSGGAMGLYANTVSNRKDAFSVSEQLVSGTITYQCLNCKGRHYDFFYYLTEEIVRSVQADSAAASINAGAALKVQSSLFENKHSTVSAASSIDISADNFTNEGASTESVLRTRQFRNPNDSERSSVWDSLVREGGAVAEYAKYNSKTQYVYQEEWYDGDGGSYMSPVDRGKQDTGIANPNYRPNSGYAVPSKILGYTLIDTRETQTNTGVAANAVIQAGGAVNITASQNLGNGVTRQNTGYSTQALSAANTQAGSRVNPNTARINAQLPPDLAQRQVNPLDLPGFALPTSGSGLFRLSAQAATQANATSAAPAPASWALGGASIDAAQRQQPLPMKQGRQVDLSGIAAAQASERQLAEQQRQDLGPNAVNVPGAGQAPGPVNLPTRSDIAAGTHPEQQGSPTSYLGLPGLSGGPTSQPGASAVLPEVLPTAAQGVSSTATVVNPQSIDRVQGLPANSRGPQPHKYLVETDPVLADLKQFMSSDYLLGKLGYDPDASWKRLGDGYFEQQMIQQAVTARTGKRFIDGQTSDEALYRYLMDNAVASKQQLGLSVGVTLTGPQVAALTHDIVWLEEHEVMGEKVLVPVLYLAHANDRLAPTGALIEGKDVNLIAGQNLENSGTLRAKNNLSASAGQDLVNSGLIQAGNRVDLLAGNTLFNGAGGIINGRDVSLNSLLGDVVNERTQTLQQGGYVVEGKLDSAARIEASNDLVAGIGRDLLNIGGVMQAGRDLEIRTGRDLLIGSAEQTYSYQNGTRNRSESIKQSGSQISAGRDLDMGAGRDFAAIGSNLEAKRNIAIDAVDNMTLASAADEEHSYSKSKKVTRQEDHVRQIGTQLNAGGDVSMTAGEDLRLISSRVTAGDEAYLYAADQLELTAETDSDYSLYQKKSKGSWGKKKTKRDEVTDVRHVGSAITTGGDLILESGGDQRYQVAKLDSGKNITLDSGGSITFEAVKDLHKEDHAKSKSSMAWSSMSGKGRTDETLRQTQMVAAGAIAINAVDGLNIDIKQVNQETVHQSIKAMVDADPQLAWLAEAEKRGDVDWRKVKEVHDSYKYSHSGMGPAVQMIIAILVVYFTAGAASGLIGSMAGATAGSTTAMAAGTVAGSTVVGGTVATSTVAAGWANVALTAVATGAASNATISFINNGGNLGAVFRDVTSSDALRGYVVSGVTAGLTASIFDKMTSTTTTVEGALPNAGKVIAQGGLGSLEGIGRFGANQLLQNGTSTLLDRALGGDSEFDSALRSSLANTFAAVGFNLVGDLGKGFDLKEGGLAKVGLHAVMGGLAAEVAGGDFKAGALAAGLNEALVDTLAKQYDAMQPDQKQRLLVMNSQLIGVLAAAAGGGDAADLQTGSWAAQNSTRYNRQLHPDEIEFASDKERVKRYAAQNGLTEEKAQQELLRTAAAMVDRGWDSVLTEGKTARAADYLRVELNQYKNDTLFKVSLADYNNERVGLVELFKDKTALDKMLKNVALVDPLDYRTDARYMREVLDAKGRGSQEGFALAVEGMASGPSKAALWAMGAANCPSCAAADVQEAWNSVLQIPEELRLKGYLDNLHIMQGGGAGVVQSNEASSTAIGIGIGVALEGGLAAGKTPKSVLDGAKATATTGEVVATEATSANAQAALRAKLSGLQKAQETAAVTRTLPDGRIRYYTQEVPARTEGPTRGASFATEFDPKTGSTRQWMESYDHAGEVIRVHPKSINGQPVDAQHYPPTGAELKSWGQQ